MNKTLEMLDRVAEAVRDSKVRIELKDLPLFQVKELSKRFDKEMYNPTEYLPQYWTTFLYKGLEVCANSARVKVNKTLTFETI